MKILYVFKQKVSCSSSNLRMDWLFLTEVDCIWNDYLMGINILLPIHVWNYCCYCQPESSSYQWYPTTWAGIMSVPVPLALSIFTCLTVQPASGPIQLLLLVYGISYSRSVFVCVCLWLDKIFWDVRCC